MRDMKKLIGAAIAASATMAGAGVAHAEVTANIALVSDYVFRGVSLSDNGPAIQGGFDWSNDMFYAGTWGSSLSDGMELDLYAGWTPSLGPVDLDVGVIGYFYPRADDDDAEFDYYELKLAGTHAVTDQISIGAGVYYSPENYGDTDDATYLEINGSYAMSDQLSFSAAYGNQSIGDPDGPFGAAGEDDYNTWNIGATYAIHGFEVDLRYTDTDIEEGSDIENYTYGPRSYEARGVLSIKREL
jgi:uncharacterized protein (TIGR02001 family)